MLKMTFNKKILLAAWLTAVLAALPGLLFTACGKLESDENIYTITFFADYSKKVPSTNEDGIAKKDDAGNPLRDENGNIIYFEYEVETYVVLLDMSIQTNGLGRIDNFPADPQRPDDYIFDGWFTGGGTRVTQYTVFNTNNRVVARWRSGETIVIEDGHVTKEFARIRAALAGGHADATYTVNVTANEALSPQTLVYHGDNKVTIILNGDAPVEGGPVDILASVISLSGVGSLFTVGENVTFQLKNVWLQGSSRNTRALLVVNDGGKLIIGEDDQDRTYIYDNGSEHEKSGGAVTVNKGGELIMNGGKIYRCSAIADAYDDVEAWPGGGGVLVRSGTFTMTGGTIEGCYGGGNGGGVLVDLGGRFKMTGGRLYENMAWFGGGVLLYRGGLFEMEGGQLHFNQAYYGGGVYVDFGVPFNDTPFDPRRDPNFPGMSWAEYHVFYDPDQPINDPAKKEGFYLSGGRLYENYGAQGGGGICNSMGAITYMTGGTLSANSSLLGAGVYNQGLFIMLNGEIKENDGQYGGGVVAEGGMFILENGSITANRATAFGGGVILSDGQFAMHGGQISGNMGQSYGGGVVLLPQANAFAMSGGVIEANISGNATYYGEGTLCFLESADPNQRGLAFYGKRPDGTEPTKVPLEGGGYKDVYYKWVPGDPLVNPFCHDSNEGGTNTSIIDSHLSLYGPPNEDTGVRTPLPWPNNTKIEVIDGELFINNMLLPLEEF
jgi:hypothetical protein